MSADVVNLTTRRPAVEHAPGDGGLYQRYTIPVTQIDGLVFTPGDEVELRLICQVQTEGFRLDGHWHAALRVVDWGGPGPVRESPHDELFRLREALAYYAKPRCYGQGQHSVFVDDSAVAQVALRGGVG